MAIATASITGRVRVKSPVISTTLASEVSGARAAEANTAPIATTAYRAGCPAAGAEQVVDDLAEGHAGGDADEQRRGEHPAGPADAHGQAARR